jgi:hypothetical protein
MRANATRPLVKTNAKVAVSIAVLSFLGLVGCASDKTAKDTTAETTVLASETVAAEVATETTLAASETVAETTASETTTADSAPTTDSTATDSAPETQAVATLAADSPTCKAFAEVKRLNDETGALSNELQAKLLATISAAGESTGSDAGSTEKIEADFADFVDKFNLSAKKSVPQLQTAYETLAKEQPQFKKELAAVEDVTVKAIKFFGTVNAKKLDTFQEDLIGALGMEAVTAAGAGTLKIDAFSRKACNLTFANS